jgi:hypothetical protein
MTFTDWFPWILSAVSCVMLWLMGNKSRWGPAFGIFNQVLWVAYVLVTRQWGFLPGCVLYTVIHARNWRRWTRPQR